MERAQRNKWVVIAAAIFTVGMFFFGYALVPIYNVICQKWGINGKTNLVSISNPGFIDKTRLITVQFLATTNANLPWNFYPEIKTIKIHPGENIKLYYFVKNNSNHMMTIQAIPSVTPGLAAAHLKKIECFCFRQQVLKSQQSMNMPVIFYLDNALPKEIREITLSYTLFEVKNPLSIL